jgi:hypothetical protein
MAAERDRARAERDWKIAAYTALGFGVLMVLMAVSTRTAARPLADIWGYAFALSLPVIAIGIWRRNRWCAMLAMLWSAIGMVLPFVRAARSTASIAGEVAAITSVVMLGLLITSWRGLRAIDVLAAMPPVEAGEAQAAGARVGERRVETGRGMARPPIAAGFAVVAGMATCVGVHSAPIKPVLPGVVLGGLAAAVLYAAILLSSGAAKARRGMSGPLAVWLITTAFIAGAGALIVATFMAMGGDNGARGSFGQVIGGAAEGLVFGGLVGVALGAVFAALTFVADRFVNRARSGG